MYNVLTTKKKIKISNGKLILIYFHLFSFIFRFIKISLFVGITHKYNAVEVFSVSTYMYILNLILWAFESFTGKVAYCDKCK